MKLSTQIPAIPYRPWWVYWCLALSFGPVIASALARPWLSGLTTTLVAYLVEQPESGVQIVHIRLAVHMGLPTLAMYAVLRLSGLGRWLALSRMALTLLLLVTATLLTHVGLLMTEFALGTVLSLRLALQNANGAVAAACLGLATVVIALTTAWYRWLSLSSSRAGKCRWWLTER